LPNPRQSEILSAKGSGPLLAGRPNGPLGAPACRQSNAGRP
jgi:hypothetical protein